MIITAEQKNSRQSDRKVRLVANSVKKLSITDALKQLAVMERKASIVVLKVLSQAIANATHNHGLSVNDLEIKSILVNSGTHYKRFRAASRGRAHSILKRTCHVKVELTTKALPTATPVEPKAKETAVKQPVASKVEATKKTAVKAKTEKTPKTTKTSKKAE